MSLCCVMSEKMESMGYSRKDVEEALTDNKYNDVMATYLLLSRKVAEVSQLSFKSRLVNCLLPFVHLTCSKEFVWLINTWLFCL